MMLAPSPKSRLASQSCGTATSRHYATKHHRLLRRNDAGLCCRHGGVTARRVSFHSGEGQSRALAGIGDSPYTESRRRPSVRGQSPCTCRRRKPPGRPATGSAARGPGTSPGNTRSTMQSFREERVLVSGRISTLSSRLHPTHGTLWREAVTQARRCRAWVRQLGGSEHSPLAAPCRARVARAPCLRGPGSSAAGPAAPAAEGRIRDEAGSIRDARERGSSCLTEGKGAAKRRDGWETCLERGGGVC